MIVRLTGRDESHSPELFGGMYRWRHRVFVERRQWTDLRSKHGAERDAYDTPQAVYFMELGEHAAIKASARLLPTLGPHVLADVFPHLVPGPIPRGNRVREISRFYVADHAPRSDRRGRIERLSRAIMTEASATAVTTLTAVVGSYMLPIMSRHGWAFDPLGPPVRTRDGTTLAVAIDVAATLAVIGRSGATPPRPPHDQRALAGGVMT